MSKQSPVRDVICCYPIFIFFTGAWEQESGNGKGRSLKLCSSRERTTERLKRTRDHRVSLIRSTPGVLRTAGEWHPSLLDRNSAQASTSSRVSPQWENIDSTRLHINQGLFYIVPTGLQNILMIFFKYCIPDGMLFSNIVLCFWGALYLPL